MGYKYNKDNKPEEQLKREFLEKLEANDGRMYETYTGSVDWDFNAVRKWRKEDPEFDKACEQAKLKTIRWVESKLFDKIREGNEKSIKFYLSTIGRQLGYQETQKIEAEVASTLDVEAALQKMAEEVTE